ncbi:MAG: alpha/beta hydrolase-fold protein [bacterium]
MSSATDLKSHPRLAIRELERGPRTAESVDTFLAEHEFPIVEGSTVTFVWRGDAHAVNLRHWVFGMPSTQPFRRLSRTDLWYLILEMPESSRVEYKIEIVRGPLHQLVEDPLNERRARDPFGANSVFHTTGYRVPDWTREDPEARPGRLEELEVESATLERAMPVTLYYPARFRKARTYPLLVVHDGPDYLEYSGLKTVLDNLIHRLEIPGLIAALVHSDHRLVEYANHAPHARFVAEELVPRLEKDLPLAGNPAGRCLMGASFGAVAAFSTAVRYPNFFGRLLLQSGSFAFSDTGFHERGPAFDPVVEFMNTWRDDPVPVANRVYVSCGTYESLIYENRSLIPLLQETGMQVKYAEARDGHNWENWRDRLREGLSWLYPGPLWMVYE